MSHLPPWVSQLPGGHACGTTRASWEEWEGEIDTFCAEFQGAYPKRTSQEWRDHWSHEYGKPQLRTADDVDRSVGEFEVVKAFQSDRVGGLVGRHVWISTGVDEGVDGATASGHPASNLEGHHITSPSCQTLGRRRMARI